MTDVAGTKTTDNVLTYRGLLLTFDVTSTVNRGSPYFAQYDIPPPSADIVVMPESSGGITYIDYIHRLQ